METPMAISIPVEAAALPPETVLEAPEAAVPAVQMVEPPVPPPSPAVVEPPPAAPVKHSPKDLQAMLIAALTEELKEQIAAGSVDPLSIGEKLMQEHLQPIAIACLAELKEHIPISDVAGAVVSVAAGMIGKETATEAIEKVVAVAEQEVTRTLLPWALRLVTACCAKQS